MSILYIIIISTINMMRNYTFLLLLAREGHGDIYIIITNPSSFDPFVFHCQNSFSQYRTNSQK